MTPKEKAQQIIDKFHTQMAGTIDAKFNSIRCVEVLMNESTKQKKKFWQEVKIEIEKLSVFGDLKIAKT